MEERRPVWRVAGNTLNKQSRTADNGWSSDLVVGRGANNSLPSKLALLRNGYMCHGTGLILCNNKMGPQEVGCGVMEWIDLGQDRDRRRALVNAVMKLQVP